MLQPIDIILLAVAWNFFQTNKVWPTQRQLFSPFTQHSLVNNFLELYQIDRLFCGPITSPDQIYKSSDRLRRYGLMYRGNYAVSVRGEALLKYFNLKGELQPAHFENLPYSFDIDESGEPFDFVYPPKLAK